MDDVVEGHLIRPDDRLVGWSVCGPSGTRPLLRVPGTPGSRLSLRSDRTPWRERGLRVVTPERPGLGMSTRLPGRGFVEHADDVIAILDGLGIERLPVYGGSGATPHILALIARHPERISAATVVVGVAPLDATEAEQMIDVNVEAYRLARAGDIDGLQALGRRLRESILADPLAGFRSIMETAPRDDQEIMSDPGWQSAFVLGMTEALRLGSEGWMDESLAIDRDWTDFDPGDARCSITWWHSDGDRNCPLSAARRLVAALPDARLHVWSDGGHLTGYRKEGEILDELLARA